MGSVEFVLALEERMELVPLRRGWWVAFGAPRQVSRTEPLSPEQWQAIGWGPGLAGASDDLDRISYGSMSPDGRLLASAGGTLRRSHT